MINCFKGHNMASVENNMALVENNCASQINFAVGILITSQIIQRYFIVANDFESCEKFHLSDFRHFKILHYCKNKFARLVSN